jgi:hypothetical protein
VRACVRACVCDVWTDSVSDMVGQVGDDCVGKSSICDMWKTGKCRPSSLCECTMGGMHLSPHSSLAVRS